MWLRSHFFIWPTQTKSQDYGSPTLMGIVSLSLLALAIVGTFHLFNIVSWVERLQDRLTLRPSLSSSSTTAPSCKRFHQRGEELLEGHLEESLCHVVKKVPFELNFCSKLPPGVKSRAPLGFEVLSDQQRHFEGNGGHGGDLPHHPDPVQVRHPGHAFIDSCHVKAIYGGNIRGLLLCKD